MQEPLIWNSLHRAAEWLSNRTGSDWDATRIIDYLITTDSPIKNGCIGIYPITSVKVRLPRNAVFASIERNAPPSKQETDTHKHITDCYGRLLGNSDAYTDGPYGATFCNLYAAHLWEIESQSN